VQNAVKMIILHDFLRLHQISNLELKNSTVQEISK
jgi:hypothetical protein